jgi:hypothetical protein
MRYGQSRRSSAIESITSVVLGFLVAYIANIVILPIFGFNVTHGQGLQIALIFTVISLFRSYFIRRLFNYLHIRDII